jgi:glutaredoxin
MFKDDDVIIYSKDDCPYCEKAVSLLNSHNISYKLMKFGVDFTKEDLIKKLGRTDRVTVPQIFINDELFGGYEDLKVYLTIQNKMEKIQS